MPLKQSPFGGKETSVSVIIEIINGHEILSTKYLGHIHAQLHTIFPTNFIPCPEHDLPQAYDLESYLTSVRLTHLRQAHFSGKLQCLCFDFFEDHGFLHDICLDYDLAMTMTLP